MSLLLANTPSTGNETVDAILLLLAGALGVGGSTKAALFIKSLRDSVRKVLTFDSRLTANEKHVEDLGKRQSDHERKDAIEAMTYMGFVEVGEDAVLVADEKGKTLMISPALAKLMGLTVEEAVNGAWKDVIHPEDRHTTLMKWEAFVAGALTHLTLRFRFQTQSGRTFPAVMKLVRKKMLVGGVMRIVGLVWRAENEPPKPPDTKSA